MKKDTLIRASKVALLATCLAIVMNLCSPRQAKEQKKAQADYNKAKKELVEFIKHRDSVLYAEYNKALNEQIEHHTLQEFFTVSEINRLNEMIQSYPFRMDSVYSIKKNNMINTNHFLMGRNIHNILLTPNSSLVDFWACAMAFASHNSETQNFSTPFITSQYGRISNPVNVFDSTGLERPFVNSNAVLLLSAKDFEPIIYSAPSIPNAAEIQQDDVVDSLYAAYINARNNLAEKQNIPSQQIHATEQLETAKKTKAFRSHTQTVLNTIKRDSLELEVNLDNVEYKLFFLTKNDEKFKLRSSLTREQLNAINQQIRTWYNTYGEVDDNFFPLSLGSSIFELAGYAHALSADVVYEADDDTELVWTNPKLQQQWIDFYNLMNQKTEVGKDYAEAFAQIESVAKQLEERKKTGRTIDSLHRAIHTQNVQAKQCRLDKIQRQNTR